MKKFLRKMFPPWLVRLFGLVALCLLIWFVGPMIKIAEFAPLGSETVRWIVIGVLIAIYIARLLWRAFQAARSNRALIEGLLRPAAGKAGPPAQTAGAEEVALLGQRFKDALQTLRTTRAAGGSKLAALGRLGGRQHVYELPWYLIIGAPGSGKTTALQNAGLRFPLAERLGDKPIRGVGGTRNCDWFFTDEAVLLDTAGRYTTQDSDQENDRGAWTGFLALLKKYRPRRPINGVLLVISASDLLQQNEAQRSEHAAKLRARLQELHEGIGIRFPVYTLITKLDLLPGFIEYFGDWGKEQREQVWGLTLPYTDKQDAAVPLESALRDELRVLEGRINSQLVERMQTERDAQQRAPLYVFPQQWVSLKSTLVDFLGAVFAASRFEDKPLMRGVYFTSGTQEGTPIDRLIGGLGRSMGLTRLAAAQSHAGTGKSFFLTRLLKEVIFQESGIAGTNLKWERRRALAQWGAIAGIATLSVAAVLTWTVSYQRNKAYVADVREKVAGISEAVRALPRASASEGRDVAELLPLLQAVQGLADSAPDPAASTPWSLGFGLYQGEKLGAASQTAYLHLLRDAMLPRLRGRFERVLASSGKENIEFLYQALKTYLMLSHTKSSEPSRFDAATVREAVLRDWELNRRDLASDAGRDLQSHLDTLLKTIVPAELPRIEPALVASARSRVAELSLAARGYNRLKQFDKLDKYAPFTIDKQGGPGAILVFARLSNQPLNVGVPGLFTYDAYHGAVRALASESTKDLAAEAEWVLGEGAGNRTRTIAATASDTLREQVLRLYMEDYRRIWDAFLRDIRVVRTTDLTKGIATTRILGSASDSPLIKLFTAVRRQTTLSQAPGSTAANTFIPKSILDKTQQLTDKAKQALGTTQLTEADRDAALAGQLVDVHFDNIRRLIDAPDGGKAPIGDTVNLLGEVHTLMLAAKTALDKKTPPPPVDDIVNKTRGESARIPDPVSTMLTTLVNELAGIIVGAGRARTGEKMRELSALCHKYIDGRYPFAREAREEVTLEDFSTLFAPGGKLEQFFKADLEQDVDTAPREWIFKPAPGSEYGGGGARFLPQFQRAKVIREVFFRGGGASPMLNFDFKPVFMDDKIKNFVLDADGHVVRYYHGPQVATPVKWPGSAGRKQVRIEIDPPAGGDRSGLEFQGTWALFRLLERAEMPTMGRPDQFKVRFTVEGRAVDFEVATSSVQNPFRLAELRQFRCPESG